MNEHWFLLNKLFKFFLIFFLFSSIFLSSVFEKNEKEGEENDKIIFLYFLDEDAEIKPT